MIKIQHFFVILARDQRGQEYVEYALMGGFAVACAAACLGGELSAGLRLGNVLQTLMQAIGRMAS